MAVITVVDAKHIIQHLDEPKPDGVENESVEQIAFADRVLLNKTDLVSEDELRTVEKRIRAINAGVQIIRTQLRASDGGDPAIDLDAILNVDAFNLQKILEAEPDFLSEEGHEHEHDKAVGSVGFRLQAEMNLGKLQNWISALMKEKGPDLYRYKARPPRRPVRVFHRTPTLVCNRLTALEARVADS
jgi:G3E family GTPase